MAKVEDCNSFIPSSNLGVASRQAPIAQLDRVSDYESEGWGFESLWAHHTTICGIIAQLGEHLPYKQGVTGSIPVATTKTFNGSVAQLVRVPACHAGGRGFEPLLGRQVKS